MRASRLFPLLTVLLVACAKDDPGAAPAAPGAPTDMGAPPPAGTPPTPGAQAPMPAPSDMPPPGDLKALIGTGASAPIEITLEGAADASLDFMVAVKSDTGTLPKLLAREKVTSAKTTLQVPTSAEGPVYVIGQKLVNGDTPSPEDLNGAVGPLTLDGKPIAVTIKLAKGPTPIELPWAGPPAEDPSVNTPGAPPAGAAPPPAPAPAPGK